MRPSQYHYLKRMWVSSLYNRKRKKELLKVQKKKRKMQQKEKRRHQNKIQRAETNRFFNEHAKFSRWFYLLASISLFIMCSLLLLIPDTFIPGIIGLIVSLFFFFLSKSYKKQYIGVQENIILKNELARNSESSEATEKNETRIQENLTKTFSIGKIQRKYNIGFNLAKKIMDNLYSNGLVGEENGVNPRKLLCDEKEVYMYIDNLLQKPFK